MISYMDMTYCPFYRDCWHADVCTRPATKEVRDDATKLGIALSLFAEKPLCHKPTKAQD